MATITVQYDARNTAFKHLLQLIIDMGGKITKVEDKTFVDSTAKDIAKGILTLSLEELKRDPFLR